MNIKKYVREVFDLFFLFVHNIYYRRCNISVEKYYKNNFEFVFTKKMCTQVDIEVKDLKSKKNILEESIFVNDFEYFKFSAKKDQRVVLTINLKRKWKRKTYKIYISNITNNKYFGNKIAHAMGEIGGLVYTNSYEAFLKQYKLGYRYFEVDLQLTKDKEIILFHDINDYHGSKWLEHDEVMELNNSYFESFKYDDKYSVLSILDLFNIAKEYTDVYFILDIKSRELQLSIRERILKEVYNSYSKSSRAYDDNFLSFLLKRFSAYKSDYFILNKLVDMTSDNSEVINRFIPQVNKLNIDSIYETYDFPLKLWRDSHATLDEDIKYSCLNGISNYSVNAEKISERTLALAKSFGVKLYIYNHNNNFTHDSHNNINVGYFVD
ncbi:glycerophosphodiester phosphodiesterase family protein [Photobacterium profundum]|uniref:GP-PDE domain-containing protein n=1 Tax=Photobacterium profundum (strain SS9) TaxID=298386 RepID=Q6LNR6_PHOPR|nr:glycerophosphodiester phosphodiesterase family protein [Photobacterium profundum]CAG21060.1 hypothetical protein PBPRA2682 [Photobacterium profundum SS9]